MNMKPSIKIEPTEYRGWTLSYSESHDHQSDWKAEKGEATCHARNPEALCWEIDKMEKRTARVKPPIHALYHNGYSTGLKPATIHTVIDNMVYFTSEGEEQCAYLKDMAIKEDGESGRRRFLHDTKENRSKLDKIASLHAKASELNQQARQIEKTLKQVTDADVIIAAGGQV